MDALVHRAHGEAAHALAAQVRVREPEHRDDDEQRDAAIVIP